MVPVVLATAEGKDRSGYVYDDRTGISYEYPDRYRGYIDTGEPFVYHQPGKGYTGVGIIGAIRESAFEGRRVCEVLDYQEFLEAVPLKDDHGLYYEADPQYWPSGRIWWSKGVRPLSSGRYEAIVTTASIGSGADPKKPARTGYAGAVTSREVDAHAMDIAEDELHRLFPDHEVHRMPHNNPGFDFRVGGAMSPYRYIEVKGTSTGEPVFFMSEGKRDFSNGHASNYTLLVVVGVDWRGRTHVELRRHDGAVTPDVVQLETMQWRGRLL
jgi:hypothetical protein